MANDDKITIDEIVKLMIIILTLAGAVVATIMFMTLETVNIFARIMLAILSWIIALCFYELLRYV